MGSYWSVEDPRTAQLQQMSHTSNYGLVHDRSVEKCEGRGRGTCAHNAKSANGRGLLSAMGDLVEGIGDEVLLFGAFLVFTACIVIVVNVWHGRNGRQNQTPARSPQGKCNDSTHAYRIAVDRMASSDQIRCTCAEASAPRI